MVYSSDPLTQEKEESNRRQDISFRFYLFFIGLIFAIVSYAGLNLRGGGPILSISLLLLSCSGLLLLIQKAVRFSTKDEIHLPKWLKCIWCVDLAKKLCKAVWLSWLLFIIGFLSIVIVKCYEIW